MGHGTREFFLERTRSRQRVAVFSAALGGFFLGLLGLATLPPVSRGLHQTPFVTYGFLGPTRHVELMPVEAMRDARAPLTDIGQVIARPARAGGGGGEPHPVAGKPSPAERGPGPHGPGEGREDVLARALAGQGSVPLIQSEELAFFKRVSPDYPEEARSRGVEGRVDVIALVDTLGMVVQTRVSRSSGEPALDRAAEVAVRESRFYPYRIAGRVSEAVARFKFKFTLY